MRPTLTRREAPSRRICSRGMRERDESALAEIGCRYGSRAACDVEIKFDQVEGDVATFSGYGSKFGNIDNVARHGLAKARSRLPEIQEARIGQDALAANPAPPIGHLDKP